jgi:hypothetical protein
MRPYTLTHTPKTFASKDTRYQATTNQEIITTTTHHSKTQGLIIRRRQHLKPSKRCIVRCSRPLCSSQETTRRSNPTSTHQTPPAAAATSPAGDNTPHTTTPPPPAGDRYGYQGQAPTRHQTSHHHPPSTTLTCGFSRQQQLHPVPQDPTVCPTPIPCAPNPFHTPPPTIRRVPPSHRGRGAVLEPATQTINAMLMFHPRAPPSTRTAEKVGHTPHPKATITKTMNGGVLSAP